MTEQPALIDQLESLACATPGGVNAQAYDALYNRLLVAERELRKIDDLKAKVARLDAQVTNMGWALSPDRMGW